MIWPEIPTTVAPWLYYTGVGLAVLITGISKSGFGGGVGILAIPLMAIAVDNPTHAIGITLPLLIACDLLSNLHYLKAYDWKRLSWMIPGACVGVLLGTFILIKLLDGHAPKDVARAMNLLIGVMCLAVVLMQVWRWAGREIPTLPSHPLSGASVGLIAGCVSTINHSAGPILQVYMLQEKLEKRIFVGTLVMYTLVMNSLKVPTYCYLGFINAQTLRDSIWFIPLIPLGTVAGAWMNKKMNDRVFNLVMYVATAITAAYMIYKSV